MLEDEYSNPLASAPEAEPGIYVYGEVVKELNVPNGTVKIGDYLFCGNKQLKSLILPESLEVIGKSAFAESGINDKVTIQNAIQTIEPYAFYNTKLSVVAIVGAPTMVVYNQYGERQSSISTADPLYSNYDSYYVAEKLRDSWAEYTWIRYIPEAE